MNIEENCDTLHRRVRALEMFEVGHLLSSELIERIPQNGLYILFEQGETGHGGNRIVRIGTHTGQNQLRSRLKQHFIKENKDRSIFRKNIGRCLLNQNNDSYLEAWEGDRTARAKREDLAHLFNQEYQRAVESKITDLICRRFQFAVLEILLKEDRLRTESGLISLVSLCKACGPSDSWLGSFSPKGKIVSSGLWQVNELYKQPLTLNELNRLFVIIR